MPEAFSIPDELVGKLRAMAKRQRKTAEELLFEIVKEYMEVQEFLERKMGGRALKPKRAAKRS